MADQQNVSGTGRDLRRRAEEKAKADEARSMEPLSSGQVRGVLHELRVHQIELELQNEELRRAQEALELSRARYFDLYDMAPVGYLTLSATGLILEANLTSAVLLGVERGALSNQLFSGLVLPEDQDIYYSYHKRLFKAGVAQGCVLRIVRRAAPPFWARMEATVAPDTQADALVARIVLSDIGELKQTEDLLRKSQTALLKATEKLDHRASQLRLLAGDLTLTEQRERKRLSQSLHDGLQQHLLAMKMRLGGVVESIGDADLKQEVDEILQLISESVVLSRTLSADLSPPILHEGGLSEGIEWLARRMRDKHLLKVELSIGTRPELPEDVKFLIFESVRELLFNALKHSKASEVQVSLEPADGAGLRVAVSDNGCGFDPSQLKPAGEDGGFGLFSIRERMSLVGGRFEVESAPSKGSRFNLIVPTLQASAVPLWAGHRPSDAAGHKRKTAPKRGSVIRVLVADDHALFRDGLARMLMKESDLKVIGLAKDGQEAIELAQKLTPDVILMDISMPGVNGIEATRAIKHERPDIRIIGLSMYEDQERAQAIKEAGATDYKTKGCEASELVAAIRECM
jgi:signal transduction histidine kinase